MITIHKKYGNIPFKKLISCWLKATSQTLKITFEWIYRSRKTQKSQTQLLNGMTTYSPQMDILQHVCTSEC